MCIFIIVKPFSLLSHVVFHKYVFILCDFERDRSLLVVGTGRFDKIYRILKIERKTDILVLHFSKVSIASFGKSCIPTNCYCYILISITAANPFKSKSS